MKPKDLVGIPWRVALALQADGWWLRSDIIWQKPAPMPESVVDRPTRAHEYIFLLSKAERYYYDDFAVRERSVSGPSDVRKMIEQKERIGGRYKDSVDPLLASSSLTKIGQKRGVGDPSGRNLRSVWTMNTRGYTGAHFATFPPELPRRAILAGTSERGVCGASVTKLRVRQDLAPDDQRASEAFLQKKHIPPDMRRCFDEVEVQCGAPWVRVVERTGHVNRREAAHQPGACPTKTDSTGWAPVSRVSDQWQPSCIHHEAPVAPAVVLDPFVGSGTTCAVALSLGRKSIGIDLNPEYLALARTRILAPPTEAEAPALTAAADAQLGLALWELGGDDG